ncbi:MAG: thioredoxin [Candidatus Caccovivens sp.]
MEIITEKNFDEKIKNGVVLVDFFATWCGPCRMLSPILEDVKEELGDAVEIYKVDVDEDENLARKFGVMSIPTIFVFVDGKQVDKHIGLMSQEDIVDVLKSYL